jgi:hypothetical protein
MNQTTNTAITNESEYVKTEEFYTKDHKFNITAAQLTSLTNKKYGLRYEYEASVEGIPQATFADTYATNLRAEADSDREQIITDNMSNQEKSNLLFAYDGTKRIYHKQFIPEQLGYKVRDWKKVPEEQIPESPSDFEKHFVMLGGYKLGIDDAFLVCKPQFIDLYKKYKKEDGTGKCFLNISNNDPKGYGYAQNAKYYKNQNYIDLNKIVTDNIMFEIYTSETDPTNIQYGETPIGGSITTIVNSNDGESYVISNTKTTNSNGANISSTYYFFFDNPQYNKVPNSIPQNTFSNNLSASYPTYYTGWKMSSLINIGFTPACMATNILIDNANIIKYVIPEHYETVGSNPFVIKDTYKPIPLSPWMLHSVHNSLESSLTSARQLVAMVGINNVKLIKYVPFGQYIKIQ